VTGTLLARLLLFLPLCYVLPSDRVLDQIEVARKKQVALHVVAELAGVDQSFPARVEADLHPELGVRFDDGAGGRWVMRRGRAIASNRAELPAWIPQLEPLVLPSRVELESWLAAAGVAWELNELGRCGQEDCFVLGGRQAPEQFWVEKDRFEARRLQTASGRRYLYEEYRDFDRVRFPGKIRVADADEEIAVWTVQRVYPAASGLGEIDFSDRWTRR
jgi:hypothetical protein